MHSARIEDSLRVIVFALHLHGDYVQSCETIVSRRRHLRQNINIYYVYADTRENVTPHLVSHVPFQVQAIGSIRSLPRETHTAFHERSTYVQ